MYVYCTPGRDVHSGRLLHPQQHIFAKPWNGGNGDRYLLGGSGHLVGRYIRTLIKVVSNYKMISIVTLLIAPLAKPPDP